MLFNYTACNVHAIVDTSIQFVCAKEIPVEKKSRIRKEVVRVLLEGCVKDGHNFFLQIVAEGVYNLAQGMDILKEFKDAVIVVLRENRKLTKTLVRLATQSGLFAVGCKIAIKKAFSTSVKGASKLVKASSPVSFVSDLAQGGLEFAGYKEAGQYVGMAGNMAGGALLGSVGGPIGAVAGAIGGFVSWAVGEAVGQGTEKFLQ